MQRCFKKDKFIEIEMKKKGWAEVKTIWSGHYQDYVVNCLSSYENTFWFRYETLYKILTGEPSMGGTWLSYIPTAEDR